MKNSEIESIKKTLKSINQEPFTNRGGTLQEIANNIGANMSIAAPSSEIHLYESIHAMLQTEMMLNACVSSEESSSLAKQACNSAKWSSRWAAAAAIISLLGITAAWVTTAIAIFQSI